MHDPVDIRRRIDRLVARVDRRDDYGQLLTSGQVLHRVEDVVDVALWRAEIRRQARADRITVRTGVDSGLVWALRMGREQPVQRAEMHRFQRLLSRVAPLALDLGHEPSVMLRDGDEVVCACDRCSALGYGDTVEDTPGPASSSARCGDAGTARRCFAACSRCSTRPSRWPAAQRGQPDAASAGQTTWNLAMTHYPAMSVRIPSAPAPNSATKETRGEW